MNKLYFNGHRTIRKLWRALAGNDGTSLPELAFVLPVLILFLVTAVDLGRAFYYGMAVSSAAHAAAIYGVQNPTDTAGMIAAATSSAPNVSSLNTNVSYGCECGDGTSAVPNCGTPPTCTNNYVNYVSVNTSATYIPMIIYPGLPKSFTLTGSAFLRSGGD
jgi:Flp pilus assembly protein TadG